MSFIRHVMIASTVFLVCMLWLTLLKGLSISVSHVLERCYHNSNALLTIARYFRTSFMLAKIIIDFYFNVRVYFYKSTLQQMRSAQMVETVPNEVGTLSSLYSGHIACNSNENDLLSFVLVSVWRPSNSDVAFRTQSNKLPFVPCNNFVLSVSK